MTRSAADRSTRTARWRRWLAVLMFGLLLVPATATGQSAERRDDIDDETAKEVLQLLRDGKKAYSNENFGQAYDLFEEAYSKWPRPAILMRLGRTSEELDRPKEALEHYRAFLQEKPDADVKDKIEKRIEALEKKVPATVHLSSTPSGAGVFAGESGDKKVGETPVELEVGSGEHTWSIRLDGYRNATRTVDVAGGQTRKLSIELKALGSQPKLMDSEDGKEPSETDDGDGSSSGSAVATFGWGTGAVGLAGIGTGVVFTVLQGQATQQVNNYHRGAAGATRSELASLKDRARRHHQFALVSYAAGGALAATGLGLLGHHYLSGGADEQASRVEPRFGIDSDGGWAGFQLDF